MAQPVARTREELAGDFLDLDRRYAALLQDRTSKQLTWCPTHGGWSVAQCIEHVARINSVYLPAIKTAVAGSRNLAESNDQRLRTAGWFSAFFLKSVSPEGKTRMRSPRIGRPDPDSSQINPEEALQKLHRTHLEIREVLASSQQVDLNRVRFRNPFVPLIRFTVGTGFLIMAGHGRRHLLQAERVCRAHGFPQPTPSVHSATVR
jgi:DinB superfamily